MFPAKSSHMASEQSRLVHYSPSTDSEHLQHLQKHYHGWLAWYKRTMCLFSKLTTKNLVVKPDTCIVCRSSCNSIKRFAHLVAKRRSKIFSSLLTGTLILADNNIFARRALRLVAFMSWSLVHQQSLWWMDESRASSEFLLSVIVLYYYLTLTVLSLPLPIWQLSLVTCYLKNDQTVYEVKISSASTSNI